MFLTCANKGELSRVLYLVLVHAGDESFFLAEPDPGSQLGQVAAQGDSVPQGHPLAGVQRQGGWGHWDRAQQSALSLHTLLCLSDDPYHTSLPLSPFSPCPHTHVAVPCSLPPATNLQGTRSWSHTGPPTPVAPRPHCHSPRMRASAIGAMRLQQLGDSATAAETGGVRRSNLTSSLGTGWRHEVSTSCDKYP